MIGHETVATQFVEADGICFAYRRFGKAGNIPLVFLQYFSGNMDNWDPWSPMALPLITKSSFLTTRASAAPVAKHKLSIGDGRRLHFIS
jgi:hypothetical protein